MFTASHTINPQIKKTSALAASMLCLLLPILFTFVSDRGECTRWVLMMLFKLSGDVCSVRENFMAREEMGMKSLLI